MATDDHLVEALAQMLDDDAPAAPPPERIVALRERAEEARRQRVTPPANGELAPITEPPSSSIMAGPDELARRRRRRHPAPWLAVAAAVVAFAIGFSVSRISDRGDDDRVAGDVEYDGPMTGPGDDLAEADLTVTATGIGRIVDLRTNVLPILPVGDFYQMWFVGPGDSPSTPNRISAGTFHPNPDGRSDVSFSAAVNPELYPVVEITAEPGDGNPLPTGPVVLRTDIPGS